MDKKSSNLEATPGVQLLKDQIAGLESELKHLHSVVGSHIDTLDKTLVKGQNIKPVKHRTHVLKAPASPFSSGKILSDFFRGMGGIARGQSSSGFDFGGISSSGMSQGQIWAQAASAISRAMKRYL